MILPSIHMNGTAAVSLQAEAEGVVRALNDALTAVHIAAPNARDYYPQGDGAFTLAKTEHEKRCVRLREIRDEYMQLLEHISDQIEQRNERRHG